MLSLPYALSQTKCFGSTVLSSESITVVTSLTTFQTVFATGEDKMEDLSMLKF
jgi:hypothetical protein